MLSLFVLKRLLSTRGEDLSERSHQQDNKQQRYTLHGEGRQARNNAKKTTIQRLTLIFAATEGDTATGKPREEDTEKAQTLAEYFPLAVVFLLVYLFGVYLRAGYLIREKHQQEKEPAEN